jgi:polar amino acid transport system permease protein
MDFSWSKVPWWAILLIITGILVVILIMTNANYRETFIFLRAGVIITLRLTLTAFPIAMIIGLFTGFVPLFVNAVNSIGIWASSAGGIIGTILGGLEFFSIRSIPMELRATLALAIGYGAFEAEVFRAGIQSIGSGQMEAARSLGMSYLQAIMTLSLCLKIPP